MHDHPAVAELRKTQQQLQFLHDLISSTQAADITSELLWYTRDGRINVAANVSDVFAWGGSDCEDITPENLPVFQQAIADLRAIHPFDQLYAPELFAARLRGMRPQGAAYPKERTATQALFNACGPARETGFGNPRRPPTPEDWQQVQLAKDHADLRATEQALRDRNPQNQHR